MQGVPDEPDKHDDKAVPAHSAVLGMLRGHEGAKVEMPDLQIL